MKTKLTVAIALGVALAAGAANAHGPRYASARVLNVEPVYRTVTVERPVRTCRREYVERYVDSPRIAGTTIAGAVVGAAIGRQFGDGRGRDALTVLGAVAGSAVANDRARKRHGDDVVVVSEPVERCRTTYRREATQQVTGYWVDYRHRGRRYRVMTHEPPGRFITVAIGS